MRYNFPNRIKLPLKQICEIRILKQTTNSVKRVTYYVSNKTNKHTNKQTDKQFIFIQSSFIKIVIYLKNGSSNNATIPEYACY